jgi:hypothetical protein
MNNRFIIESPTRGVLRERDVDSWRFSLEGSRNDPEKAWHFSSLAAAQKVFEQLPEKLQKTCVIRSEEENWEIAGSTERKYMLRGSMYEPSCEGADSDGHVTFYDVVIARSEQEAIKMAEEDYGDMNVIRVHGIAKTKEQEKAWIARNPS